MRILITGAGGQLGADCVPELRRRGHEVLPLDHSQLDITDRGGVLRAAAAFCPDAVLHCAAWTAVDAAEERPDACRAVNVRGTENVAAACREAGAALLYLSTDYVFSGAGTRPWRPGDECRPRSVYGASKRAGEEAVLAALDRFFIVRSSWIFGKNGHNFVGTMLRLGREGRALRVVDDQIGAPAYTRDLARLLADMAESERYGVYHAANAGFCSRYELARETLRLAGVDAPLAPVRSADYPQRAARPLNCRLDTGALAENGFAPLPPWRDALARYLKEL